MVSVAAMSIMSRLHPPFPSLSHIKTTLDRKKCKTGSRHPLREELWGKHEILLLAATLTLSLLFYIAKPLMCLSTFTLLVVYARERKLLDKRD